MWEKYFGWETRVEASSRPGINALSKQVEIAHVGRSIDTEADSRIPRKDQSCGVGGLCCCFELFFAVARGHSRE